jgi:hypothetical protein
MSPPFVSSRNNLWNVYTTAKTYSCRPSELLGIDDTYVAYCLDNAVAEFGAYVSNELEKVEGKTAKSTSKKREAKLKQLLTDRETARFADPAKIFK